MNQSIFSKICTWFFAFVMTFGLTFGAPPPSAAERKIQIIGDLLILPVDKRPNTGKTADGGMLEVFVNGTLIHRALTPRALGRLVARSSGHS